MAFMPASKTLPLIKMQLTNIFNSFPTPHTLHLGSFGHMIWYMISDINQQPFTIKYIPVSVHRWTSTFNIEHYPLYLNLHNSSWWSFSSEYWVKPLWGVPETFKEWRIPHFNFQKRIRIGGTINNEQWQSDQQLKAAVSGLHERKTRDE